jgi:hypothetical protein
MVKVTYRGWAGHFICADKCMFRLNTLIEGNKQKIVVSTVGNMVVIDKDNNKKIESIGYCGVPDKEGRFFETMVFVGHKQQGFIEANTSKQISLPASMSWAWGQGVENEKKAQKGHEKAVSWVVKQLEAGKQLFKSEV